MTHYMNADLELFGNFDIHWFISEKPMYLKTKILHTIDKI